MMATVMRWALCAVVAASVSACGILYDPGSVFHGSSKSRGSASATPAGGDISPSGGMTDSDGMVSPPPPPSDQRSGVDNAILRFQTLRQLLDAGLITREEYNARRGANLGALLRYSVSLRPAAGLERPAPPAGQVLDRLRYLAKAYQDNAITEAEQLAERRTILDALLPPRGGLRADLPPPVTSDLEAAKAVGEVERMYEVGVITTAEMGREKKKILSMAAAYQAQQQASQRMAAGTPVPEVSTNGPAVRLALVGNETRAWELWSTLRDRFPDELGSLQPVVRRVSGRHHHVYYGLYAGSITDQQAAKTLCRALKKHKQSCTPVTLR